MSDNIPDYIKEAASKWALKNADETMATNSALNRGFIAGAMSPEAGRHHQSPVWVKVKLLESTIEDLIMAIPKQDNDNDWWPDSLTEAVRNAEALLNSEQEAQASVATKMSKEQNDSQQ